MAGAQPEAAGERRFLFVCGCPHSGIFAVARLLSGDPRIALGVERYSARLTRRALVPADFAVQRFFAPLPDDSWYEELAASPHADHYRELAPRYASARYVGDAVPRAYECYSFLAQRFPDLRVMHMIRDIHAVVLRHPAPRDCRQIVATWNRAVAETLAWQHLLPLLVVSYETLFEEAWGMDRLARFLELNNVSLFADLQHRAPGASVPNAVLLREELDYIAGYADFEGYRQLREKAQRLNEPARAWRVLRPPPATVDVYAAADREVIDYDTWRLPGSPTLLRGPAPPSEPAPVVCLGSAATFGRLVRRPFPLGLAQGLGYPVLNAGIGGARPATFLADAPVMAKVSQAPLVVLEMLSARGYATRFFTPAHTAGNSGVIPAEERARLSMPHGKQQVFVDWIYERAFARGVDRLDLEEARASMLRAYVADMKRLIAAAGGPVILVYLAQRAPDYRSRPLDYLAWSGGFPHFVDRQLLELLKPLSAGLIEVVSDSGLPAPVRAQADGRPVALFAGQEDPTVNIYYASQEMHEELLTRLLPLVRRLLPSGLRSAPSASA